MRASEFIAEGVWGDLQALGKMQQSQAASAMAQKFQKFKGSITPQFYKDIASQVAQQKASAQTELLVDTWVSEWNKEFARLEKANAAPFSDDQYRGLFRNWLEKASKVKIDDSNIRQYIPVQSQQAVRDYMSKHFIPKYLEMQSNPMFIVPDGETVDVVTQVGNKKSGTRYTWSVARGRWADQAGNEVPSYTQLHTDLTQQAMEKASSSASGTRTVGGGGEGTI